MYINNYFNTTIWSEQKPEFIKSLTKASNKYIKAARNFPEAKKHIKEFGDFGRSYHSTPLTADNDFIDFRNYDPHMRDEAKHLKQAKEILPKGSIIVFPSFVWHRVKPVTKGTRYSLVMWNLGYPFK